MPLGSIVIITIYPPEKRGAAMGTMGIAMILAPAIGPTLSGYIVTKLPLECDVLRYVHYRILQS